MTRKSRIRNYLGRDFKKKSSGDRISKEKRSSLMSKIRSKETKLEMNFIVLLKKSTRFKFATHQRDIMGNPDVVFKSKKICVFIDSDFWHGWQYPRWKHSLKNDFWREKIEKNRKRDSKVTRSLRRHGWKIIRIWEHEIKNKSDLAIKKIIIELKKK